MNDQFDTSINATIIGAFIFLLGAIISYYTDFLDADGVMNLCIVPAFVLMCFPVYKIYHIKKSE